MQLDFVERYVGEPKAQSPVLVMIHGRGDNPSNFIHLSDGVKTPRRELALRGPQEIDFGFDRGWQWFNTLASVPDRTVLGADIRQAADLVAQNLRALNQKDNTPSRRYVISGFSQGGMLSYALALRHPALVSQALPIAGLLPPCSRPSSQTLRQALSQYPPIQAFHGLADPQVCPNKAHELIEWLKGCEYPVLYREYPGVEHTVSPEMLADYESALTRALEAKG